MTFDATFAITFRDAWNRDDLFAGVPKLRGVRFNGVMNVSHVVAQFATLPQLEFVEIVGAKLSAADVALLASIPNLQYLRLESCQWENSLRELEQTPRLRRLIIVTASERTAQIVTADVDPTQHFRVPHLPQLEVLAVDGLAVALVDGENRRWPTDADLASIGALPKLRRLYVRDDAHSAKPMREIERALPHVLVLPIYTPGGNLLFMSLFFHGIVIMLLATQINAQSVTTLSPVVPRFWPSHQIVFIGLALALALHQTLQLWVANVAFMTAMGMSLSYYTVWAITAFATSRRPIVAAQTTRETIIEWLLKSVSLLMIIGFAILVMTKETLFQLNEMQIFLIGKNPQASLLLLGAGLAGLIALATMLPSRFRMHYENYDTLPPMTFTYRSQVEWAQMVQEKRKRKLWGAGRFADLTPGCVFNNAWKRSQLLRDGNKMTMWRWLGHGLLSLWIVIPVWILPAFLRNDASSGLSVEMIWLFVWFIAVFPTIGLMTQWEERRRAMGLELLRPVPRLQIRQDILWAVLRDSAVLCGFQVSAIVAYCYLNPQTAYVSVPLLLVLVVSWCLLPVYVMILITTSRDENLFDTRLFIVISIVVCHGILIFSQSPNKGEVSPITEWIVATFAFLFLFAYIQRAYQRWKNLEWDV
ncbi:MAG: hypothetical protein WEB58_18105 [Planctomycetaceae bacterium]